MQWSTAERAATFIYLNKTCFNGLWRVNRAGGFNVPIGRYIDPPICVPDALRAASLVLARAEIRHADYATAIDDAKAGDFLYFDPPYDPINADVELHELHRRRFSASPSRRRSPPRRSS